MHLFIRCDIFENKSTKTLRLSFAEPFVCQLYTACGFKERETSEVSVQVTSGRSVLAARGELKPFPAARSCHTSGHNYLPTHLLMLAAGSNSPGALKDFTPCHHIIIHKKVQIFPKEFQDFCCNYSNL